MTEKDANFCEVVQQIYNQKILLPDFQRNFVWKDEARQKQIVASVLAKMPIGSILLLEAQKDEFLAKQIGCKRSIDNRYLADSVHYLLDGQQRITVLSNVFSDVVHNLSNGEDNLAAPSLKRRFFLRIPKWLDVTEGRESDLFGVEKLNFPYSVPEADEPLYLTSDIVEFVECFSYKKSDPFNPNEDTGTELDNFCIAYEKGYLIPLFLLLEPDEAKIAKRKKTLTRIVEKIAQDIAEHIAAAAENIGDGEKRRKFVSDYVEEECVAACTKNLENFEKELDVLEKLWSDAIRDFLKSCVSGMKLYQISVEKSKRARAIDIYENLNRGGVSLNSFDLIMARVANVQSKSLYQRLVESIESEKTYDIATIPECIGKIYEKMILRQGSYNASLNMQCYDGEKNEIAKIYLETFLNVICLYDCYIEKGIQEIKIDYIKQGKILSVSPKSIDTYCEKVCTALDRAMFFFQTRCGLRKIAELNYNLIFTVVAFLLMDEKKNTKKCYDILEAWYWSVLFSGRYDTDQGTMTIISIKKLYNILNGIGDETQDEIQDKEWLCDIKEKMFAAPNFSDKEFLLLENAKVSERYPKRILRYFICQYYLSCTYSDMFEEDTVSVFSQNADDLEVHHMIPLGSMKNYKQSTKQLRDDDKNILNSPLNFVYITKTANKEIGAKSLKDYQETIRQEAYSALDFAGFPQDLNSEESIKAALGKRFEEIAGKVKREVTYLIDL